MNLIGWLQHVESPWDQLSDLFCSVSICCHCQILQNNNSDDTTTADDTQIYLALSPDDYSPTDSQCQSLEQIQSESESGFIGQVSLHKQGI